MPSVVFGAFEIWNGELVSYVDSMSFWSSLGVVRKKANASSGLERTYRTYCG